MKVHRFKEFSRHGKPVLATELQASTSHCVREMPVLFQLGLDGFNHYAGGEIEVWATVLRRQLTLRARWRWRKGSWCWRKGREQQQAQEQAACQQQRATRGGPAS